MSYMLLIHEAVGQRATRSEDEGRALYERMLRFGDALREEGVLLGAQSLAPQSRATRVQVEGGKTRAAPVIAPVREAIECPAAEWATVEVRALAPCYES